VFYVFLIDGNVESKVAIQEEIRARSISIVNAEGQEVINLCANKASGGIISIYNKDGTLGATMIADENGGMIGITNKAGNSVVVMGALEDGGRVEIDNKAGTSVIYMGVYKDNGLIEVYNKYGKMVGSLP
jgi:hypothetical protein